MAKLNQDLAILQTTRDEIKSAIIGKGQEVGNDIRTYPDAISNIGSGIDILYNTMYSIVCPNKQVFNKLSNILDIDQEFIADGGTEEEIKEKLTEILSIVEVINE